MIKNLLKGLLHLFQNPQGHSDILPGHCYATFCGAEWLEDAQKLNSLLK